MAGSALENLTPDLIAAANRELLALVDARLPERFYQEPRWRLSAAALVARIADLVDSITRLLDTHRQTDTSILVRALYEHVVTLGWLLIDPEPRFSAWHAHALEQQRRLHTDALAFGVELLSDAELAASSGQRTLPQLQERSEEFDAYWAPRIRGLHQDPAEGPRHLLTVRGLYTPIYRQGSRPAHAELPSIDPCVDVTRYPNVVRRENTSSLFWSALSTPLFAIGLVTAAERLGWPDEEVVRRINDGLFGDDASD